MKNRESRLNKREENTSMKNMKTVSPVLISLAKQGLSVEDYFRSKDVKGMGMLSKKVFCTMLQQIGVPLGARDILEITKSYISPNITDNVEYEKFITDVNFNRVSSIEGGSTVEDTVEWVGGRDKNKKKNVRDERRNE